jgi:enoyl-CoA hydratase
MAADFRICSDKAKFGQPEVGLGVTPGFGGTQRLPRLIGSAMAKQILYTGETIGAEEAFRIGLVNRVVPAGELLGYVMNMAAGQLAVSLCKAAVNEGMQTDIDRALAYENDIFGLCFSTHDQKEGMGAFMEKRKPQFTGK